MRRFLITASVLCFALPAYAQEGAITVIQDDGTKVTVPIEGVDPVLPGETDAPPQAAAPVPPAEKPLIVPEVETRFVDPIVEPPPAQFMRKCLRRKRRARNRTIRSRHACRRKRRSKIHYRPVRKSASARPPRLRWMPHQPAAVSRLRARFTRASRFMSSPSRRTRGLMMCWSTRQAGRLSSALMSKRMSKSRPRRGICRPTGNHMTPSPLASRRLQSNYL